MSVIQSQKKPVLHPRDILQAWWPLAASWMLMSAESPAVTAAISNLKDTEIHPAAIDGIVFPISYLINAPIVMFLSASTALCNHLENDKQVRKYDFYFIAIYTSLCLACVVVSLVMLTAIKTIFWVIIGTTALSLALVIESLYIVLCSRSVVRNELVNAPITGDVIYPPYFLNFSIPLALTSMMQNLVQSINSAALSRMLRSIESLASISVVMGLAFVVRSMGIAYNKVFVSLLDHQKATQLLRRFAFILSLGVCTQKVAGLYIGVAALVCGALVQTLWLRYKDYSGRKFLLICYADPAN